MKHKTKRAQLLDLWYEAVKLRDGYRSVLSGIECRSPWNKDPNLPIANAHHLAGKSNLWLALDLDNGVTLTQGEHGMGVHSDDPLRQREFMDRLICTVGKSRYHKVAALKHRPGKPDLTAKEEELQSVIRLWKEGI